MKMLAALSLSLLAGPALAEPVLQPVTQPPQRRGDQVEAFEARRQGKLMPLKDIERRIIPLMGNSQYLGVDLDGGIYTFKFLRDGNVMWLYVDGQTGKVLRQAGQ